MKKNLGNFDKYKDTIRMDTFVSLYLNDGNFIECKNLTHKELKMFDIPYVINVSYDFVEANKELVLNGKIILVRDRSNNLVPYINPIELRKLNNLKNIEEQINNLKKQRIKYTSKLVELWSKLQMLLYQQQEISDTITILKEVNRQSSIEQLGGKSYVKKY